MKHMVDPRQNALFDAEVEHFGPRRLEILDATWYGVFRRSILAEMPAEELGREFSADKGRPTKELYAMAGLVLISQMFGMTSECAALAYSFDNATQYALNVGHGKTEISPRTVERYQKLVREKDLPQEIFARIAGRLAKELGLQLDKQRLDSTHVFSDMARMSRAQMMATCIRRFLAQLKRHHNGQYAALDAALRDRCLDTGRKLFGAVAPKGDVRDRLRQQVAEDMATLVARFADDGRICGMSSYKALARAFAEQCEIAGNKVAVRSKTGSRAMQNPSDPDATLDGHKGNGYQLQLAETCHPDNPVQLITCAIPQTAADEDGDALELVVESLENAGAKPAELLADTHCGSDENQQACALKGIDLVAPVRGNAPGEGFVPVSDKQKRLARRREEQSTPEWKKRHNRRAGIEATNSGLKRRLGLGRLRVRGKNSVYCAMLLKAAGWNVLRAAAAIAIKLKKNRTRRKTAPKDLLAALFSVSQAVRNVCGTLRGPRLSPWIRSPALRAA